jgi:hypothetical protein
MGTSVNYLHLLQLKSNIMKEAIFILCERFSGVKEIGINEAFDNKEFEQLLLNAGWYRGAPWCSFTMRAIFKAAGAEYKYISGSAWRTALNGSMRGYVWTDKPKPGALMIWRNFKNGKPQASGHIALVKSVTGKFVSTYEGNSDTDDLDKIQEFGEHVRKASGEVWKVKNGLRLMGFLYPPHLD